MHAGNGGFVHWHTLLHPDVETIAVETSAEQVVESRKVQVFLQRTLYSIGKHYQKPTMYQGIYEDDLDPSDLSCLTSAL
jgi:hypothetical protein